MEVARCMWPTTFAHHQALACICSAMLGNARPPRRPQMSTVTSTSRTSATGSRKHHNVYLPGYMARKCRIVPYGVLGVDTRGVRLAPEPDAQTAFVDPAGLHHIQGSGPAGAGGASGAIYTWLGIAANESFALPVKQAIVAPLQAKYHKYHGPRSTRHCIHAVGPDLRRRSPCVGLLRFHLEKCCWHCRHSSITFGAHCYYTINLHIYVLNQVSLSLGTFNRLNSRNNHGSCC
eukprot:SAG11_NODE_1018_length_6160_cov_2.345818_1_plen_233_part_00